jgi:hypothetical protein
LFFWFIFILLGFSKIFANGTDFNKIVIFKT